MNIRPLNVFLATADSTQLRDFLLEDSQNAEVGQQAMAFLLENRPVVANEVLCLLYGIAVYQNGNFVPDTAPEDESSKWFVSVLSGSAMDIGLDLPLADSEEQAYGLAVAGFKLQDTFFGVAEFA